MAVPQERLQPIQAQIHADTTGYEDILTPDALAFLARLHHAAEPRRQQLLKARHERQSRYDAGCLPNFRSDTRAQDALVEWASETQGLGANGAGAAPDDSLR